MIQPELARRLNELKPSATLAISQRAAELRSEGRDIISFSVGEPDFETPGHIQQAAKNALAQGVSHYTAVPGLAPLREAVAADSTARRGCRHGPNEVLVSTGAKQSLYNLMLALIDPGDEVIIPAPYWVSYPEQVRMAGGTPTVVSTHAEDNFCLQPKELSKVLNKRSKALILCTPSNPTGAAYDSKALALVIEQVKDHSMWIIADEIYGRLVYDGFESPSILSLAPELKERVIVVDGVSKTYAMTGWRIGWALGPANVIKACSKLQSQSTSNAAAISQMAALEAIKGDQKPVDAMRAEYQVRRDLLVDGVNAFEGLSCARPQGAFYAFVNIKELIGRKAGARTLENDLTVASWLLDEAQCAVVPGTAFGAPGYLRFSYATSRERIQEGLLRIGRAVAELR